MRPILDMVLGKAKISRKFSLEICYGSFAILGLGFDNLFIYQGYDQIVFLLRIKKYRFFINPSFKS